MPYLPVPKASLRGKQEYPQSPDYCKQANGHDEAGIPKRNKRDTQGRWISEYPSNSAETLALTPSTQGRLLRVVEKCSVEEMNTLQQLTAAQLAGRYLMSVNVAGLLSPMQRFTPRPYFAL